jgi:hypothetical protein
VVDDADARVLAPLRDITPGDAADAEMLLMPTSSSSSNPVPDRLVGVTREVGAAAGADRRSATPVRLRYQSDTVRQMAMTLRLTEAEQASLRERAAAEGISMQDAARRAVREYVDRGAHRDRVAAAADRVRAAHAGALERLGE